MISFSALCVMSQSSAALRSISPSTYKLSRCANGEGPHAAQKLLINHATFLQDGQIRWLTITILAPLFCTRTHHNFLLWQVPGRNGGFETIGSLVVGGAISRYGGHALLRASCGITALGESECSPSIWTNRHSVVQRIDGSFAHTLPTDQRCTVGGLRACGRG